MLAHCSASAGVASLMMRGVGMTCCGRCRDGYGVSVDFSGSISMPFRTQEIME